MVVLQRAQRALDRVDQATGARLARADAAGRQRPGAVGVAAVEDELALLDRPAVVATQHHAVDFLDVALAHVGGDQVASAAQIGAVEGEAVGVAEAVGKGLGHLARSLERVARRDAVLAVGADGVGTAGRQRRVDRVDAQHLAQRRGQVLRVAAGLDVAGADVVGIAAIAQAQVQVAVGPEGDGAAVVVVGVLAERHQLTARRRVHLPGGGVHLPFGDQVAVALRRAVGRRPGGQGARRDQLAGVGVERAVAGAAGRAEARVEGQAEEAALVVGIAGHQRWRHPRRQVHRRTRQQAAVLQHPQQAVLLDDEQLVGHPRGEGAVGRCTEPGGHRVQAHGDVAERDVGQHRRLRLRRAGQRQAGRQHQRRTAALAAAQGAHQHHQAAAQQQRGAGLGHGGDVVDAQRRRHRRTDEAGRGGVEQADAGHGAQHVVTGEAAGQQRKADAGPAAAGPQQHAVGGDCRFGRRAQRQTQHQIRRPEVVRIHAQRGDLRCTVVTRPLRPEEGDHAAAGAEAAQRRQLQEAVTCTRGPAGAHGRGGRRMGSAARPAVKLRAAEVVDLPQLHRGRRPRRSHQQAGQQAGHRPGQRAGLHPAHACIALVCHVSSIVVCQPTAGPLW